MNVRGPSHRDRNGHPRRRLSEHIGTWAVLCNYRLQHLCRHLGRHDAGGEIRGAAWRNADNGADRNGCHRECIVAKAPHDGYTLLLTSTASHSKASIFRAIDPTIRSVTSRQCLELPNFH